MMERPRASISQAHCHEPAMARTLTRGPGLRALQRRRAEDLIHDRQPLPPHLDDLVRRAFLHSAAAVVESLAPVVDEARSSFGVADARERMRNQVTELIECCAMSRDDAKT